RDKLVTGVQTCALPISAAAAKPGPPQPAGAIRASFFFRPPASHPSRLLLSVPRVRSQPARRQDYGREDTEGASPSARLINASVRSEERRVGKEGRWRWG